MFRQSPGRNQRPKGIKVNHVLQICFLLVVCFWLLYQVNHSHDKRKELDGSDAKISARSESSNEVLKLGRKNLHPKVEETAITNRKQDEEAEEEEESVGEEEENKREEEQQQHDQKFDEVEDDGKAVAEDELDEHEREKSDAEVDQEEEAIEEEKDKEEGDEKESEENDSEDNIGQLENESSLEDHDDDDGTAKNTHEAREEHYKADDASSAVTHETQIVSDENENEGSENKSNELSETNTPANESQVNNTEKYSVGESRTDLKTEEREMLENSSPLNTTANKTVENVTSKSEDSSLSSASTSVEQSKDHPLLAKNTTEVITGPDGSSMQNGTETQNHTENVAAGGTTSGDGSGLQNIALDQGDKSSSGSSIHGADSMLATSLKTGETDPSGEDTSKTDNITVSITPEKSMNSSIVTEDNSESSTMEKNNAPESEKLETDDGTGGMGNDALKTENPDEVPNDPIDSSDSSITLEKNVRIDLDTLPEIQTEATKEEDAAAE